jgi:hypothetical protein
VRRGGCFAAAGALALAVVGCGKLQDFGGLAPPVASFSVTFSGDLGPLRPAGVTDVHALRVALVWGAQWLTEPFCVLPAKSLAVVPAEIDAVQAVIDAGCRDPFGFVPASVGPSVPLDPSGPTTLSLDALPTADLLVGDVTARVGYGSMVVFDDRDHSGTLELAFPQHTASGRDGPRGGGGPKVAEVGDPPDIVYGASFVTMTTPDPTMPAPDRRVAYREGGFAPSAFYPRAGCPAPRPGFSVVGSGGFTEAEGLAAALAGELPAGNPAFCFDAAPAEAPFDIVAAAPADVEEVSCDERTEDSSIRYREPPGDDNPPDFMNNRLWACAHLPTFDTGMQASTLIQLVVSGRPTDRCKGLTHYTLRGCREDVNCSVPDWDFTSAPPAWWPCH